MRHGKIFLCTWGLPGGLPKAVPDFLGPARIYALSLPPESLPVLASVEVPLAEARDSERLRSAAFEACEKLWARLPAHFDLLSRLTTEPLLVPVVFRERAFLHIDASPLPEDLARAQAFAQAHAEAALALLESELPQIPFRDPHVEAHAEVLRRYGNPGGLYDVAHPQLAATWHEITRRKKLLLHVCCGPDAAGVISQLKRDYDVVGFWYDPNIQPEEEHAKRLDAFRKVAAIEGIPLVEGEYDVERFMAEIQGLEHTPEQGAKCSGCYDMRLERAAVEAKRQGCDLYATTLAISPHKVQMKLRNFGLLNERKHGVPYLARNFVKHEGFNDSVEYSRRHEIYRQDYCGCWYSLHEGGPEARETARALGLTHAQVGENSAPPALPSHAELAERHAELRRRGILAETQGARPSDSGKNYG